MSQKKSVSSELSSEQDVGPERFPTNLLSQSPGARQVHFERCLIEHTFLTDACTAILNGICMLDAEPNCRRLGTMVLVIGPSRVGKTTLINLLEQELLQRAHMRMQEDRGYNPFVSITTDGSGNGRFDWKDYYMSVLRQLQDPFLRVKRFSTSTRDLREVTEEALLRRGTEVILVDEAHHLAKARSGRRLQDHLDHLKYFENKTGVSHVLVGTYEMRPFRTVNAQLACRSIDVHFPRYDATKEKERAVFKSVVWALERQLPLPEEPDLMRHWEFLYARSLGCVGLLKQHLCHALRLALAEDAHTVTFSHLRQTALHKQKLDLALESILDAEKDLLEAENADQELLIKLGMRSVKDAAQTHSPRRSLRPGERVPGRDTIGDEPHQDERSGNEINQAVS
ncbi:MAG: ATP-binding protein [Ktedonobacteraceae bacterium]